MCQEFLERANVGNEEDAMRNSIRAALRRNPTYQNDISQRDRGQFREALKTRLRNYSFNYQEIVADKDHLQRITEICDQLSNQYGHILLEKRLRIGTVQKALNLYLKFLWCLELLQEEPPHCPVDRVILATAGIMGNWTQLDDIDLYMDWINQLRQVAQNQGYPTLSAWEISVWSENA